MPTMEDYYKVTEAKRYVAELLQKNVSNSNLLEDKDYEIIVSMVGSLSKGLKSIDDPKDKLFYTIDFMIVALATQLATMKEFLDS